MYKIVGIFQRELPVIKQAPFTFISALIILLSLSCVGIFIGVDWAYDKTIKAKDAVIQSKDATIENLKDRRSTIKTLIFDGDGNKLVDIGADKLIKNFNLKKIGKWDVVVIELQTKGHLEFTPSIQTITDSFWIVWDKIERTEKNTIKWTGHYGMYNKDKMPQFKMEIFHKD